MKVLLFGGSGVMGTAIDRACRSAGIECLQPSRTELDVTDPGALCSAVRRFAPEAVVNAVAMIGYEICESDPGEAFRLNSLPASCLAKLCEELDVTFVQLSTHAVFDGSKDGAYTEADQPNPLNCYAATKYLAEMFCRNLCRRHYIVRLPTIFGPRRNNRPGFVDKVMAWAAQGESLRIASDKIDSPTYSLDAAQRLISLLQERSPYGVYHLANRGAVSYYDFVVSLMQRVSPLTAVMPVSDADFPFQGKKPLRTAMSSARLPAMRSWSEALQEYLDSEGFR